MCACACACARVCVRACVNSLSDLTKHRPPHPAAASAASAHELPGVGSTAAGLACVPGQATEEGRVTHAAPVQDRAAAGPPQRTSPSSPRIQAWQGPPLGASAASLSEEAPLRALPASADCRRPSALRPLALPGPH